MLVSGIALFYCFTWKLQKKNVTLQRGIKIVKIWQDTSTLSDWSFKTSVKNTAKTC